ncbi:MAG: hypothetical protein Q8N13_07780 [Acidovorax sp.]|nr:hypothetical protein [Acidovorax sp.]
MQIVEALKKFNRKERYWVIRNALGPGSDQLGEKFRRDLQQTIGLEIPGDAWWSIDYHIDWLVGALALFVDDAVVSKPQDNSKNLVKGNQEDIDLVVAFGNTLILIEAKGDTSWSNVQLNSKLPRLEAILGADFQGLYQQKNLSVYFVLMSPKRSMRLLRPDGLSWPNWMTAKDGTPLWMPMQLADSNESPSFFKVTRCQKSGAVSELGNSWKVI